MKQKKTLATALSIIASALFAVNKNVHAINLPGPGDTEYTTTIANNATGPTPQWNFFALELYQQIAIITGLSIVVLLLVGIVLLIIGRIARGSEKKAGTEKQAPGMIRWGKLFLLCASGIFIIAALVVFVASIVDRINNADVIPL